VEELQRSEAAHLRSSVGARRMQRSDELPAVSDDGTGGGERRDILLCCAPAACESAEQRRRRHGSGSRRRHGRCRPRREGGDGAARHGGAAPRQALLRPGRRVAWARLRQPDTCALRSRRLGEGGVYEPACQHGSDLDGEAAQEPPAMSGVAPRQALLASGRTGGACGVNCDVSRGACALRSHAARRRR